MERLTPCPAGTPHWKALSQVTEPIIPSDLIVAPISWDLDQEIARVNAQDLSQQILPLNVSYPSHCGLRLWNGSIRDQLLGIRGSIERSRC